MLVEGTFFIAKVSVDASIPNIPKTSINTIISLVESALTKSKSNRQVNVSYFKNESIWS